MKASIKILVLFTLAVPPQSFGLSQSIEREMEKTAISRDSLRRAEQLKAEFDALSIPERKQRLNKEIQNSNHLREKIQELETTINRSEIREEGIDVRRFGGVVAFLGAYVGMIANTHASAAFAELNGLPSATRSKVAIVHERPMNSQQRLNYNAFFANEKTKLQWAKTLRNSRGLMIGSLALAFVGIYAQYQVSNDPTAKVFLEPQELAMLRTNLEQAKAQLQIENDLIKMLAEFYGLG